MFFLFPYGNILSYNDILKFVISVIYYDSQITISNKLIVFILCRTATTDVTALAPSFN